MNKKYVVDDHVIIKRRNHTNIHFMRSAGNFQRETPLRLRVEEIAVKIMRVRQAQMLFF